MPTSSTTLDTRTGEPVDYESLLREAQTLAKQNGCSIPSACSKVAGLANYQAKETIERQLRRLRERQRKLSPSQATEAPAGFWVLARDIQEHVSRLEAVLQEMHDNGKQSAPSVRHIGKVARETLRIAEERRTALGQFGKDHSSLQAIVGSLGDLEPSLSAGSFISGEKRSLDVIVMTSSRILSDAVSTLAWLEDRDPVFATVDDLDLE